MAIEKFPVEKSHVMMFARSIGDSNKIYFDEDYAKESKCEEIIAPPTFVQSSAQFDPDYFLWPKVGNHRIEHGQLQMLAFSSALS